MDKSSGRRVLCNLGDWDKSSTESRVEIAQWVASLLPPSITLQSVARHTLGDQSHETACFQFEGAQFALVPGCVAATLGYDRNQPFLPTPAQAADWENSIQKEFGDSLHEALDMSLTPLRQVTVEPTLFEVKPRCFPFDKDANGRQGAMERIREACAPHFRLPTVDEWEYACAAGTRTLFRWGNDCPSTCSYEENQWDLHQRPNAFGLLMNSDTYQVELCEGQVCRGGDGGGAVHGGIGSFST